MHLRAPAILCSSRVHGEHGAVLRLMTADHGLLAGYCAGARGRRLRPLLIPGNLLDVEINARSASQLPFVKPELLESRGPWLGEPLASAGIGWATALTAATLPEGHAYPALYDALGGLLEAICHAPSARGWALALAAYETLVLRELGYGGGRSNMSAKDGIAEWDEVMARLDRTGAGIATRLLGEAGLVRGRGDAMAARLILMERLRRIAGAPEPGAGDE